MRKAPTARLGLLLAFLLPAACGRSGSSVTAPTPPPAPTYSVTATVFYDENGSGLLDASEIVRVPGVEVVIGNASAKTAPSSGQAVVSGIIEGTAAVAVRVETLPWYFQATPLPAIQVPGGPTEVRIPLTLSIGNNNPNVYLGFGDSITAGDGSTDGNGYGQKLQALLSAQLGYADVRLWGRDHRFSWDVAYPDVIRRTLRRDYPAYALILFGTNDWHDCQNASPAACYTIASLRTIVQGVKDWNTLPVLATIPPVNPALAPAGRSQWFDEMNVSIKALAAQQQVAVADLNAEFKAAGNLPSLFFDDVHPNDAGYQVMAQGWAKGITRGRAAANSRRPRFFSLP